MKLNNVNKIIKVNNIVNVNSAYAKILKLKPYKSLKCVSKK